MEEVKVEKKVVEPFRVICSREKLRKLDKDPLKPPPLGTYNPKLNRFSTKIWRRYDLERTQSAKTLKTRPLTYSKLMSSQKYGSASSKKFRSRPQTANFSSKNKMKSQSMKRLRP